MAEYPDVWKDPTAERRPLFGHEHAFGVSADVERARQNVVSAAERATTARREREHKEPALVRIVCSRRGGGDKGLSALFHRINCRRGHHEIHGGHALQLGAEVVFVARRCRWCDTTSL